MTRYVHQLSPWQRDAMQVLRGYPDTTLGAGSKLTIGAQGLVKQGLATVRGIPTRFTLTDEGRAEHDRRWDTAA